MEGDRAYLVRYGLMGHVGRFAFDLESSLQAVMERGQAVVIQTDRGEEIGEVLVPSNGQRPRGEEVESRWPDLASTSRAAADEQSRQASNHARLLRPAAPVDLENARRSMALRAERFALCQRILTAGEQAVDLIDVEPLLDQSTTVLHVLGDLDSNMAALRAEFRSRWGFDVVFEAVGSGTAVGHNDAAEPAPSSSSPALSRRCGDCDCQEGGCGLAAGKAIAAALSMPRQKTSTSCGVAPSHSGCASCGVSKWLGGKARTEH